MVLTHFPRERFESKIEDNFFKCIFFSESVRFLMKKNDWEPLQVITRSNADPVHRRNYAALGEMS